MEVFVNGRPLFLEEVSLQIVQVQSVQFKCSVIETLSNMEHSLKMHRIQNWQFGIFVTQTRILELNKKEISPKESYVLNCKAPKV